jgi:hypothetical protein
MTPILQEPQMVVMVDIHRSTIQPVLPPAEKAEGEFRYWRRICPVMLTVGRAVSEESKLPAVAEQQA